MEKSTQINLWYVIAAVIGILLLQSFWTQNQQVEEISYSRFLEYVDRGKIAGVSISGERILGDFTTPQDGKSRFATTRVDPAIADRLSAKGVEVRGVAENRLIENLLSWLLPVVFFFALWMFVIRRLMQQQGGMGGFMSIGRSKAKIYVEKDTKVTFADVAGVDEAKRELQELVAFLRNPQDYGALGARIPKGVLLVGPPGTGKTLLARAMAGEAGVAFFSISGSEFVEMFVGVGAARVRDLFEQARKHAPAIIFIDELDSLGRARGSYAASGGHDEQQQTLNQLLAELDGFDPSEGVVLLAATNRPEVLDPALLRAGRFDRQVLVDRPDKVGRGQILRVHLRKIKMDEDVDVEQVSALTTGFTGADLANLVNEAALMATRRQAKTVTLADFTAAIERIVAGLEKKNRLLNPREREVVAHHEMGHALVALALPGSDKVHKVSIIPRGIGSLGYTIQRPTEDRYLMSRRELENKIAVLLGGRAAEKLIFNELSTGAADDLAKATDIARSMVARYGMDEELGYVTYDSDRPRFLGDNGHGASWLERQYSDETARRIDAAVRTLIAATFARATAILERNRPVLEQAAAELLRVETLDEEALAHLTANLRAEPTPAGRTERPAKKTGT